MRGSIGLGRRSLAATTVVALAVGSLAVSAIHPTAAAAAPPAPAASSPVAASAETAEAEPTAEELANRRALEELASARRELREAETAYRSATSASNRADSALRGGEEALVEVLLSQLEAERALTDATRALRRAAWQVRRLDAAMADLAERTEVVSGELDLARVELERRVIRSYKTGSLAYETSLPLTIIREATSPSELATAIKHLSTLMAIGLEDVEGLVAELESLETTTLETRAEVVRATRDRDVAVEALAAAEAAVQDAETVVEEGEARAAGLRHDAYSAEATLLAAVVNVRQREQALVAAEAAVEAAAARVEAAAADEVTSDAEASDAEASDVEAIDAEAIDAEAADARTTDAETSGVGDDASGVGGGASGVGGDDASGSTDAPASNPEEVAGWVARERALERARSLADDDRRAATGWVCPVPGGRFVNDWGFPRSHQRRHEGTDVFAAIGTPLLAPTDAVVADLDPIDRFDGRRDLGGITVTLEQGRHRFYLAHLDAIHPDLEVGDEVSAGTLVGWVGRTGNARGTPPHLHLGWYVDRVAVNPYASLAVACSGERTPNDQAPSRRTG